jgi:hypothetical protein
MVKLGTFCEECCFYNPDKRTCKHGMFDRFKNKLKTSNVWETLRTDPSKLKDEAWLS